MDDSDIAFRLDDLVERSDEQARQIRKTLEQMKPVQCDILGERTIEAISRGIAFDSVEGGRHMNLMETITLLSGIATLAQFAMVIISGLKSKLGTDEKRNAELPEKAQKIIVVKIASYPELRNLSDLIAEDPVVLERILQILLTEGQS